VPIPHHLCLFRSHDKNLLFNVVGHLLKIGLRRKDHTTSTHHGFCDESSNLERKKINYQPNANKYELFLYYQQEKKERIFTVSGPSLRIRFSKLLASLVENSSSVSSISTKLFSWHWILVLLYVKLFTDVRYQKDGSASSEGSLCAEQKVLVDQTSDEVQANYRLRRN